MDIVAAPSAQQIRHQHAVEARIVRIGGEYDLRIVVIHNDIWLLGGPILRDDLHMGLVAGSVVGIVVVSQKERRPVGIEEVTGQVAGAIVIRWFLVGRSKFRFDGSVVRAHNDVLVFRVQLPHIITIIIIVVVIIIIIIAVAVAVAATSLADIGGIVVIYKYVAIRRGLSQRGQETLRTAHSAPGGGCGWVLPARRLLALVLLGGQDAEIIVVGHLQIQRQGRIAIVRGRRSIRHGQLKW